MDLNTYYHNTCNKDIARNCEISSPHTTPLHFRRESSSSSVSLWSFIKSCKTNTDRLVRFPWVSMRIQFEQDLANGKQFMA